jgi:hypothetical protein
MWICDLCLLVGWLYGDAFYVGMVGSGIGCIGAVGNVCCLFLF